MSHADQCQDRPPGFRGIADSKNTPFAAIEEPRKRSMGSSVHPEVVHTQRGLDLIKNFLFEIANVPTSGRWSLF